MWEPVVARLADDPCMTPLFGRNDLVLLDQSHNARVQIDPNALYILKRGDHGMVRRLLHVGEALLVFSEQSRQARERIAVDPLSITHFVRARATLIAQEREWESEDGASASQDFLAA
jgi:hypothetical protein